MKSILIICLIVLISSISAYKVKSVKSADLLQDPYTIVCNLSNNATSGCNSNVCDTIENCMNYLHVAIQKDNTKNTTIVVIPREFVTCPTGSYNLPASKLHVFYSTQIVNSIGFGCDIQFLNVMATYPTDIVFDGLVFKNFNGSSIRGGVIQIEYPYFNDTVTPSLTVYDTIISKSVASEFGGAIYTRGYTVNVVNSLFEYCESSLGGAVYSQNDINIERSIISDCVAQNPNSNTFGGAAHGNKVVVYQSVINSNAASSGGAIYGINVFVDSTYFNDNLVMMGGSAVFAENSTVVYNSTFNSNTATSPTYSYGAIYCPGVLVNVIESTFVNNFGAFGGAVASLGTNAIIVDSTFENNRATVGGAVYAVYNLNMINSAFYSNYATKQGGAIAVTKLTDNATLNDSYFYNNTAQLGGAIFGNEYTFFNLLGSTFKSNVAIDTAGGLYSLFGFPIGNVIGGRFLSNFNTYQKQSQTFNDVNINKVNVVNVSILTINDYRQYVVPLVYDTEGARAYDVTGLQCVNGEATILQNGFVTSCSCYEGWTGSQCNQPI